MAKRVDGGLMGIFLVWAQRRRAVQLQPAGRRRTGRAGRENRSSANPKTDFMAVRPDTVRLENLVRVDQVVPPVARLSVDADRGEIERFCEEMVLV